MKQPSLLPAVVLAVGLCGLFFRSSAWAGWEFEPPIPNFPYGPTDPLGTPYCVAATDLIYSPTPPYVRASSEAAKLEKSKRASHRPVKRNAESFDAKGRP
ncbi:hypothetical protein [Methylacidimicrobium sp. B4]|uniref:hypothetical protein n=1 Tax=Methylacidimicrobium sp. B4 TaxID=2796139 RepID=UPI001A907A8C|nr:hypothetical protein [Methylacidimicrobium sp. B4]QSR84967.1 hypothetical protein MacB4_01455 [Methylacidimicrobium sp. B4]